MLTCALFTLVCALAGAHAHGGHGGDAANSHTVDSNAEYIRRHMANEHHIDAFDLESFFKLHDLNGDGQWTTDEIEAIYGVHHLWNPKERDAAKIKEKSDAVVARVLKALDTNENGRISLLEFEAGGFGGLPDLKELGAEGHHYDVESEFFLHHEELFHATPDTQTDESYTHPEDLEHFANHEHIEQEEERREHEFHGLSAEELAAAEAAAVVSDPAVANAASGGTPPPGASDAPPPADGLAGGAHPHDDQAAISWPEQPKPNLKNIRGPAASPGEALRGAKEEADRTPEWGIGDAGYTRPRTDADKMRRNLPYKYKFRRNWGDF